ncbi:hypothetical protein [Lujinxingia litoralis]|uniref:hypothetical protein n=1 Tax=Lujinxingia litoralis TaxID=2211119 RepID=UPI0011B9456F|nr:hypothetical protein [Lujinxingia litoralis]
MLFTRLQPLISTLAITLLLTTTLACGSNDPVKDNTDASQIDAGPDAESDTDADEESDTEVYRTGEACPSACHFTPGVTGVCAPCEEGWCIATNTDTYCTRLCENNDECSDAEWSCMGAACEF